MVSGSNDLILSGWDFQVTYGTDIVEILKMATVGPMGIPQASPGKHYSPKISGYELACDRFNLYAFNADTRVLSNNGCADIYLIEGSITPKTDLSRMYTVSRSNGRVKVVAPTLSPLGPNVGIPNSIPEMLVSTTVGHQREACVFGVRKLTLVDLSHSGITSPPSVVLTKCLSASGKSVVMSKTSIHFLVPRNEMFHSIATSIFGDQNELVLAMQESVNNKTLTTLPANVLEELTVVEAKVTGTQVTALICQWKRVLMSNVPYVICTYLITNSLVTKPQPIDPKISLQLVNKGLLPKDALAATVATLVYLPQDSRGAVLFEIPKILEESASVAHYFASIGSNFVVDWDSATLHIIFEIFDVVKGYEVPDWVFFSIIGLNIVCLIYLVITEFVLPERYRESLYKTISREILGGQESAKPRLHRFDPKTLEFEGHRRLVVSTSHPQLPEDDLVAPS
ncbi:hypothetical protein BGZ73_004443 [Actinomortierella ambigua]|nr:hypothetical protein BGZ73_004443 [Actinomortierella ambigua]